MDSSTMNNRIHNMVMSIMENCNDTTWFEDNFEHAIYNIDDDNNECSTNEEYNQDFDFNLLVTNVDTEEMINEKHHYILKNNVHSIIKEVEKQTSETLAKVENDQATSIENKMKRSLSTPTTSDVISKKFRDNNNEQSDDNEKGYIPQYLQTTNKLFQFIMTIYIKMDTHDTMSSVENLQALAILKHQIALISQQKKLWEMYLQLGTGQWADSHKYSKVNVNERCFWSNAVKSKATIISMKPIDSENEQTFYETTVNNHLKELDEILVKYQYDYDMNKDKFKNVLTLNIEQILDTYVQYFGIEPFKMKLNYKITMLQYEYEIHLLECEYQRHKPNESQIQIAKRLYHLQYECVQAKKQLIEHKQRLLYNKPMKYIHTLALSVLASNKSKETIQEQHATFTEEKHIQTIITDLMVETIVKMIKMMINVLTNQLVELIFRRFSIIQKKLDCIANFRINYLIKSHRHCDLEDDDDKQEEKEHDLSNIKHNISCSPTIIINTSSASHQLTDEQLKLLNRGPSYTPPCQLYVSSTTSVSIHDMIEKQYKILQHNLNILFAKYHLNTARSMFINRNIKDLYMNTFDISLPESLHERALYEKQLIRSIREHLKQNDLILRRTADQKNIFYLTNRQDFETLANDYLLKTDAFQLCDIVSSNDSATTTTNLSSETIRNYFKQMIKSMNLELQRILHNKKLHKDILEKLSIDENKIHMPYLYFLPEISKVNKENSIALQPVIVAQHSATYRLAQLLDELFEPVLLRQSLSTTFKNEADFIQKLNQFTANEKECFQQKTLFVKVTITNFHTIASHAAILNVLEQFLRDCLVIPGLGTLSIQKLIDLTTLYLNHNRFFYNNKIYRCVKGGGGPNSLSLTHTLSQIYIHQWQNILLKATSMFGKEFFGRCKNEFFFTWNKTTSEYHELFANISKEDSHIQLDTTIDSKIQFLNVYIENQNGILYTNVYHDDNTQKYTLPYVIGHTQVEHSHWFQSALIRAVRCCPLVQDFNRERIYLEVTCLTNGYSLDFIEHRINHFYTHFNAKSLRSILDQDLYDKLRERSFSFIQQQRQYLLKNEELEKKKRRVQLTYLYEYGSKRQFNDKLQQILTDYLNTNLHLSTNEQIKIILNTKQQYSLNALLSQQKPQHDLFDMEK